MKSLAVVAVALAAPLPALADPPPDAPAAPSPPSPASPGFVGAGVVIGAGHLLHAAWGLEGAVAIPGTDLFVRVAGQRGGALDFEGTGSFWRAGAGVELHAGVWLLGVDAGYQHETWTDSDPMGTSETHYGLVVGPRAGLDVGGERVRVRASLALFEYHHASNVAPTRWEGALDLALGLAYRF
ncbi:MAG TPA: hypothetical protein VLT45_28265 [Kofleriaceae bacterium]|nr:hypothetical protein [Kofleriaceae bacterium]